MNIQELIRTASWLTTEEIMLRPLVQLDSVPTLEEQRVHAESEIGIFTDAAAIAIACGYVDPRSVFLSATASEDDLRAAHGRCRYLAETQEELRTLDALVGRICRRAIWRTLRSESIRPVMERSRRRTFRCLQGLSAGRTIWRCGRCSCLLIWTATCPGRQRTLSAL